MFTRETKGCTNTSLCSINSFEGILFGPEAFDVFSCLKSTSISSLSHGVKKILLMFGSPKNAEKWFFAFGIFSSTDDPIFVKKWLNEFAIPVDQ